MAISRNKGRKIVCYIAGIGMLSLAQTIIFKPSQSTNFINTNTTWLSNQEAIIPAHLEEYYGYCEKHNIVLDRTDHLRSGTKAERPYSVTNFTFANFHQSKCPSLAEAQLAIRNGTRRWVNADHESLPPLQQQEFPSYFVPHGCDLPMMSVHEMCETLNSYSHFITEGDSLSRQMFQGLMIGLGGDLAFGGTTTTLGSQNECRCDGQFSEHDTCRQYVFIPEYLQLDKLCPPLPDEPESKSTPDSVKITFKPARVSGGLSLNANAVNCDDPNNRGILLAIQGGAHSGINAEKFINDRIYPLLNNSQFIKCREMNKLKVIWLSYGSQSRQLDGKYPHQTRENGLIFNLAVERVLKKYIQDIVILDWWGLTAEAQTSDGFHFLTDVNLVKANLLLNIMSYL